MPFVSLVSPLAIAALTLPQAIEPGSQGLPGVSLSSRAVDLQFLEVGGLRGLDRFTPEPGLGTGMAIADVDDDGDIDLYVATATGVANQFYRNDDGVFVDIGAEAGLNTTDGTRSALWLDYDGDGDLDLVTAGDGGLETQSFHLYQQGPSLTFTDVTEAAGLLVFEEPGTRGGLSAGDLNEDGYLEIFFGMVSSKSRLYQNNTDGTFTDISESSGILVEQLDNFHWQSMMADFNGDGWLDIYVCVDVVENLMFINQQDGTFDEVAKDIGVDITFNDMGMSLGDFDADGDFDIVTTNIYPEVVETGHNVLLRNDSVGAQLSFEEIAEEQGIYDGGWGWGITFFDADLDGDVDLAATNGLNFFGWEDDRTRFFRNHGSGPDWFSDDEAALVGLDDDYWGSSLLAFDQDRDGDLDLLQTTLDGEVRLMENVTQFPAGAHHLVVKPRLPGPNKRAIGSTVTLSAEGKSQLRLITAGTSFMGQEPAEAFFGVARARQADSIQVDFADGQQTIVHNIPLDRIIEIAPAPITHYLVQRGAVADGGVLDLRSADAQSLILESENDRTKVQVGWTGAAANALQLTIASSGSVAGLAGAVSCFDWQTETWNLVGLWQEAEDSSEHSFALDAAYQNDSGAVLTRILHRPLDGTTDGFQVSIDQIRIEPN